MPVLVLLPGHSVPAGPAVPAIILASGLLATAELVLGACEGMRIVTAREFLDLLEGGGGER